MKSRFEDIDNAIKYYIKDEIYVETHKELEELIFFSSYTIKFDVFKKGTQKLKKILREKLPMSMHIWEEDATRVIQKYHLAIDYGTERYTYLLRSLLKAQIKINEAVMGHFIRLCKQAHSFEYIESRAEQIYKLLFDGIEKEALGKTSSSL
ncbi:hypothetical protein [Sulfurospirillum oryzae]|uniref:hypothetical protein n=1 Tax=Sulfurospirillum oryzae TaxID=2976535 RepID=UPI0021E82B73|nr:hypothetical protein [Sulfurospirillum oryzae]